MRFTIVGRFLLSIFPLVLGLGADGAEQNPKANEFFEISWWSIEGASGISSGLSFELHAILGQPSTGVAEQDEFRLYGGFLAIERATDLFEDGFETGDHSRWSESSQGTSIEQSEPEKYYGSDLSLRSFRDPAAAHR